MIGARGNGGGFVVGCSGYDYPEWRGAFYPENMAREDWFDHYASVFGGVEINNTFFNLPEQRTIDAWRARAPRGFVYALKLSRYGTHMKRLKEPDSWLGRFVDRALGLECHLGPVLVQLPPHWHADPNRLRGFFEVATSEIRWAVEFRDATWVCEEILDILRAHNASMVLHDMLDPPPEEVTADWVYARYHGTSRSERYAGAYSHQKLTADAARYAEWIKEGRRVFAFFNNDVGAQAPQDAQRLDEYTDAALDR